MTNRTSTNRKNPDCNGQSRLPARPGQSGMMKEVELIGTGQDRIIASPGKLRRKSARKSAKKSPRPPRSVRVNRDESPLGWLFARDMISQRQFDAGEKLRSDWERARLSPSITMSWDFMPVSRHRRAAPGMMEASELQIAARQRFDGAMQHIGRDLNDVAWRVICAGETLTFAEKNLGWPARSAKLVLRLALDRLAEYYRIS